MKNQIEKRLRERGHSDPSTGVKGIQLEKPRRKKKFWPKEPTDPESDMIDGDIFDVWDIQQGDYVDFGAYGKLYVCSSAMDDRLRVTDRKEDRFNSDAAGWYMRRNYAKRIIEEA